MHAEILEGLYNISGAWPNMAISKTCPNANEPVAACFHAFYIGNRAGVNSDISIPIPVPIENSIPIPIHFGSIPIQFQFRLQIITNSYGLCHYLSNNTLLTVIN